MSEGISARGLRLLEMVSIKKLTELGSTDYLRWQNIKRGKARLGADEVEILGRAFPAYRWWLMTGEASPELEQASPDDDEPSNQQDHPE
ncbi:DNA-binding protein [Pseudomonas nitroreducens]|uniref:DNA-binding protein n=1 Tax=Pseudomonas nitroreducens TaxID=46680 RepID=UPI00380A5B02